MDEYAYEIHMPDSTQPTGWMCKDDTRTVTAGDEQEAQDKANQFARTLYTGFRTRNVRLIKRCHNPDGEI